MSQLSNTNLYTQRPRKRFSLCIEGAAIERERELKHSRAARESRGGLGRYPGGEGGGGGEGAGGWLSGNSNTSGEYFNRIPNILRLDLPCDPCTRLLKEF